MTLGQRIQDLRKQHNLSQEALGEKLGVSRQAISRWEMDGAVPEVDKLIAMGKLFGISLNDLLQVEEPAPGGQTSTHRPEDNRTIRRLSVLCGVLTLAFALSLGSALHYRGQATDHGNASAAPVALVAAVDHSFAFPYVSNHLADCTVNLTAAQVQEDLTVTLQLLDESGELQLVPMEHVGGSVYTATFQVDRRRTPITCSALFEGPSGAHIQSLVRWRSITANTTKADSLWP